MRHAVEGEAIDEVLVPLVDSGVPVTRWPIPSIADTAHNEMDDGPEGGGIQRWSPETERNDLFCDTVDIQLEIAGQ